MAKYGINNKPIGNPNPDKTFCRDYKYKDLDPGNFDDLVSKFEIRIKYWFLKPTRDLMQISDYAEAFYSIFRCGLLHNAMITADGRISGPSILKKIIKLRKWNFGSKYGGEIAVNPTALLNNLEKFFKSYIKKLRNKEETNLRQNFAKKLEWDFGIKIVQN